MKVSFERSAEVSLTKLYDTPLPKGRGFLFCGAGPKPCNAKQKEVKKVEATPAFKTWLEQRDGLLLAANYLQINNYLHTWTFR